MKFKIRSVVINYMVVTLQFLHIYVGWLVLLPMETLYCVLLVLWYVSSLLRNFLMVLLLTLCPFTIQDRFIQTPAHHHSTGGVIKAVYSGDGQYIFSVGGDGVLSCWQWKFTQMGMCCGS